MKPLTEELATTLASDLLEIGAVSLSPNNPYVWASGLKSPVYCDNRLTLGHPQIRSRICEGFAQLIHSHNLACDVVGGIATAGIPHAAWLADRLSKPMIYVRGEAKKHGRKNQLEGELQNGSHVVLIEDLVSTGKSSVSTVHVVQNQGAVVSAILAIFSYDLAASKDVFAQAGIPLHTLTTFPVLISVAESRGYISELELESLRQWHLDPGAWSASH